MEITAKKRLGTHYAHYLYRHQETSWSSETLLSVVFAHRRVRLDVRVIQLDCFVAAARCQTVDRRHCTPNVAQNTRHHAPGNGKMGYALIDVLIRPRGRRAALHNAFVCVRELQNVYCDQAAQYVLLCLSRTRADIALAPVMFMRNGATKNLAPPPEEVKLYALRASSDLHPWADTGDVCSIVDAKAQLPGMILNPSRLRRAVCDELAARQPEFEERYRRRRIQHQRALEQMVRERAAEKCKKRAVAKRASASAAAGNDSTSVAERRLQERNRAVASLEQLGSELRTLRARGAPDAPRGPRPKRGPGLAAWNDQQRAHEKHTRHVQQLRRKQTGLRRGVDEIGMSSTMLLEAVEAYLPPRRRPAAAAAAPPPAAGDRPIATGAVRFPALAPYLGLPPVDPLAHYKKATPDRSRRS